MLACCWILLCVVAALCEGLQPKNGEADWIDPMDPFSHDPATVERDYSKFMEEQKKKLQSEKEVDPVPESGPVDGQPVTKDLCQAACTCKQEKKTIENLEKELSKAAAPHMPFFKQYVARLLQILQSARQVSFSSSKFEMLINLHDADIEVLQQFSTSSDDRGVQSAHSVLDSMIEHVRQVDIPEGAVVDWLSWIRLVSLVILALSSCFLAIHLQYRMAVPWPRVLGSLLVLVFVISLPWTWWHLYQDEVVRRIAASEKERPAECDPKSMTYLQYLWSQFSLTDKCEEFYSRLHIDPWLDVPPTKAVVVTISKMVVEPLQHLGQAISKMVLACLKDLPTQLWPVALVFLFVILTLLLLMSFGYKIKLFYLFGLEPSTPAVHATDQKMLEHIQYLTEQIHQVTDGNRNLQQLMNEQRRSLDEQLGQPVPLALPSVRPEELGPTSGSSPVHPAWNVSDEAPPMSNVTFKPAGTGTAIPANPTKLYVFQPSQAGGDPGNLERIEEIEVERRPPVDIKTLSSSSDNKPAGEKTVPGNITSATVSADEQTRVDGGTSSAAVSTDEQTRVDTVQPLSQSILPSSFDSLVHSTVVLPPTGSSYTPSGINVQDPGLPGHDPIHHVQDLGSTAHAPVESSDDSDLEIIEESDSISQG